MTRPGIGAAIGTTVLALTVAVRAQQAGPPQRPTFRSSVDVVQVDVAVVDRDGRPVKGLSAGDFTLLENGKPQDVAAFAEVSVPAAPSLPATWLRDVPPDVRSNALGDGRLIAVVMDDATMPPDLRIAANARQIGRDVVTRMGPDDLAAVIFVNEAKRSVDFTNDRARLLAAIDGFNPGFAYVSPNPETDSQHYFASIRTLGLVSALLTHVPQRRKAVIYVSTGVPMDPVTIMKAGVLTPIVPTGTVPVVVDRMDEVTSTDLFVALSELIDGRAQDAYGAAMEQALIRAQHGNVNIYSVDPAGLGGLESYLQTRVRSTTATNIPVAPLDAAIESRRHRDFLQSVADNSGGRAILNTNNFETGLTRIFEDNSTYYLVGYQSEREPTDERIRLVTVRMNRPGLSAHTRNAYASPRETRDKTSAAPDLAGDLEKTLAGVLPNPAVILRASSAAFALPDGRSGLAVCLGVEQHVFGDVGARVNEELSVRATAYAQDGKPSAWVRQSVRVTLRAGLREPATYEVLSRMDLDPGRYQIRLAAHSAMTGKTGSVYFDAVVPAFAREALQLSGLALSAIPSRAVVSGDGVAALLPVVPTSRRTFAPADAVSGFLRVYQHGARTPGAVSLRLMITDGEDRIREESTEVVAPDRFSNGQADVQWRVPVSQLAAGEYLLTAAVTQGARTIRRDVRFAVRAR